MSVMPALLAERLGIPQLSGARKLDHRGRGGEGGAADRRRVLGAGGAAAGDRVAWDSMNEPRYPSFKGIMAAKKKPVETGAWPTWVGRRQVGLAMRGRRSWTSPAARRRAPG